LLHTRPAPRPVQDRHESRSAAPLWVERSAVWYASRCSEVMTGTYLTVDACRSPLGSPAPPVGAGLRLLRDPDARRTEHLTSRHRP